MNAPPTPNPDADPRKLRQAIAAIEAQRGLLGDEVTELAVAPLQRLLTTAEAVPRLRRAQVTILFADIVDSSAIAEQLDAEDVLQIFGAVLQGAAGCVRARGGRVLRFTGDGLKAAFGTEGAHEDDAAQAVQAGLDILAIGQRQTDALQGRLGSKRLALRVGVHTGEVAFGAGFEAEQTLTGDAVNVAARMEQSAPPDGLRISADTWAQVRGRFIADAQPPLQLKGISQPASTWLVRSTRGAAAVTAAMSAERGIEGVETPMVGRTDELARVRRAIADGHHAGELQALTLIGDAGLGKSRLLREALQGRAGIDFMHLQARAQPRDGLRPWGLLRQWVADRCRIADSDSAEVARGKVLAGLSSAFEVDAVEQAQLIGQLIGLDFADAPALRGLDARALRDRALAALLAWLAGLARQGPGLVLVVEDLHWADEASLDALAHLSTQRHLPMALLMSSRPELLERRPDWGRDAKSADDRRIALQPLAADHGDALAAALLPGLQPVPAALHALLTERAEGNPYYMEELVRRLLDDGVVARTEGSWTFDEARLARLRLPSTLVGLLQARLDGLPEAERESAQRASIVGHVFWDAALAEIDPASCVSLPALLRRHWIRHHPTSAFEGTHERRFDHHLLHQVTYGTVLKEERRRGHAAVARWLVQRTEGRAPEFLAITGEHAERAGNAVLAADCYERAGASAQQRFANALAIDCLQRALDSMPADDTARRLDALERLREIADTVGQRDLQARTLDAMLALLGQHPDPRRLAALTMSRAMLADRQGRMDDAFDLSTEALAQAEAIGDDDTAALAHGELCWLSGVRGHPDDARRHQSAGQVCAERVRDTQPIRAVQLLMMAGLVALNDDRVAEAGVHLNQALDRAQGRFDRVQLSILGLLCKQAEGVGDWPQAALRAERQAALARKLGDTMRLGSALHDAAITALARGETVQALAVVEEALASLRATGNVFHEAHAEVTAGDAFAQGGDPHAARAAYERARSLFARAEPNGARVSELAAMVARQDLALGDIERARAGAEQAMKAFDAGDPFKAPERVIAWRWACAEVLEALGDARAQGMQAQLREAVQRTSLRRAGTPEGARELQQRIPIFRRVMARFADLTISEAAS